MRTYTSLVVLLLLSAGANTQVYFKKIQGKNDGFEYNTSCIKVGSDLFTFGTSRNDSDDGTYPLMRRVNPFDGAVRSCDLYENSLEGGSQVDAAILIDDHFYMVGTNWTMGGTESYNVLIVCVSIQGNLVWTKVLGDDGRYERAFDIDHDQEGNIVVAAVRREALGNGATGSIVHKISPNGDIIWSTILSGKDKDYLAKSVAVDDSGSIYLLADSESFIPTVDEMSITKVSTNGDSIWTKYYPVDRFSSGHEIHVDADQHLFVAGEANLDKYNGAPVCFYMSLDTSGTELWMRDYEKYVGRRSYQSKLHFTEDGKVARSYDSFGYPTLLLVNADGTFDSVSEFEAFDLYLSSSQDLVELDDGSFVIMGTLPRHSFFNPDNIRTWLLRTHHDGTFVSTEEELHRSDFSVFPNPTHGLVTISEKFQNHGELSTTVLDADGSSVMQVRGSSIDMSSLPAGQYMLQVTIDHEFVGMHSVIKL